MAGAADVAGRAVLRQGHRQIDAFWGVLERSEGSWESTSRPRAGWEGSEASGRRGRNLRSGAVPVCSYPLLPLE